MPVRLSFKLEANTVPGDLRAYRREMDRRLAQAIFIGTREVWQDVIVRMPSRTGELRRSYQRVHKKRLGLVGSALQRARYSEFGTKHQPGNLVVHRALARQIPRLRRRMEQAMREAAR